MLSLFSESSAIRLRAFSSEVDTGSREENVIKQRPRAAFRFDGIGKGSRAAVFVCGIFFLPPQLHAEPGPDSPFTGLSGRWSGSGTVTMTNGSAERIRCRATYSVNATGRAVQQTLRCASDSYRLEISSNVMSDGGSISGSWTEATHGINGSISGRASSSEIVANVSGDGFTARLDVRTHGDKQSVTIRPQSGTDVAAVSIALRKG